MEKELKIVDVLLKAREHEKTVCDTALERETKEQGSICVSIMLKKQRTVLKLLDALSET